ncbi:PREDICTED: uncharacterized protein LOC108496236 isoform X2 [Lepidothrix coronata]|nr:PREDICTED: uncharacterized protein LOC108496236 isoform X2 [Lepidothrix coronata]
MKYFSLQNLPLELQRPTSSTNEGSRFWPGPEGYSKPPHIVAKGRNTLAFEKKCVASSPKNVVALFATVHCLRVLGDYNTGTDWRHFTVLSRPSWKQCLTLEEEFITYVTPTEPVTSYHHVSCSELDLARAGLALDERHHHTASPKQFLPVPSFQLGPSDHWDSVRLSCRNR